MKIKNQKGQFVIEAVLIMVLLMGLLTFFVKTFREQQLLAKLVESPWEYTSGMIEGGVWAPPAEAKTKYPYQFKRFYTPFSD